MPELPEVETVRRDLDRILAGVRLDRIVLHREGLRTPFPRGLPAAVRGRQVQRVERRAKYLLIRLDRGGILCHLGMTGTWRVRDGTRDRRPHDHADLHLADGRILVFNDPRRFGLIELLDPTGSHPALGRLGAEPLDPDFSGARLAAAFAGRRSAIKAALMDQRLVVGVGNIYAAEALFAAGIDPHAPAGRVARARLDRLAAEVVRVLTAAIAAGGTTIRDYRQIGGELGTFRGRVYDRGGEPCAVCAATLRHGVIAGRSTAWCPRCQRR